MSIQWSLLCPVDFSPGSRGALRYALAIARRFHSTVTVLTVDDALLDEVGDTRMGTGWAHANSERELRTFVAETDVDLQPVDVNYEVRAGKPAPKILEVSAERGCQLIVLSTYGRSGVRKLVFGATAERVLRETTVPVLLAPENPGTSAFAELARRVSPILAPVDFGPNTGNQVKIAGWLADALHARLLIGHVLEPLDVPSPAGVSEGDVLSERHRRACRGLQSIALNVPIAKAPQILLASGSPSEEIARWATDQHAGLLVMTLRSDAGGGPRMGSVTYRAIADSHALTLALPPAR